MTWWAENSDSQYFDQYFRINKQNQIFLETIFGLMDTNGDRELSREDFTGTAFSTGDKSLLVKWESLKHEFDQDGSQTIGPHEFVEGMKKLALKEPVTEELTAGLPHFAMIVNIEHSLNSAVERICFTLLDTMITLDEPTLGSMREAWRLLDVDGDGTITSNDFVLSHGFTQQAEQKWEMLRSKLDRNNDGTITQDEFLVQLKHLVLSELSRTMLSFSAAAASSTRQSLATFTSAVMSRVQQYCTDLAQNMRAAHA
uniref:EF-hand domain-containing protein n=1 Tax=Haptolina ericina TaxID=156174 RepID=A0A7S3AWS9_9EUKA